MKELDIKSLVQRIERLEKLVLGKKSAAISTLSKDTKNFSGATGGMRFLISKGFFKSKRALGEIRDELTKNDYHYSLQAVQTGVNRLSKLTGPLVAFKEKKKKVYATRK